MKTFAAWLAAFLLPFAAAAQTAPPASYYSHAGHDDVLIDEALHDISHGGVGIVPAEHPDVEPRAEP